MASEHSFDVVCKLDKQEVDNALQQTLHELGQRYDFKNAKYDVKFDQTAMTLTLSGDSEFRLQGLSDVLDARLAKRQIPLAAITREPIEVASGGGARQVYKLQTGIPTEKAKEIVKRVKDLKLKVQATIQSDQVRIAGKDLDELQAVQKAIRGADLKIHVQFVNYR
ncbi:MAG: YajQ family cyclic di-GMP-binding protein [Candidatus Firestonebacteria bacterium]|nr:YajQ family cyclic di-GMP-binding protein [Candidatus Firestonebacteria bacterium]